ncbi:MAG: universal stress protein [Nitrospira sp. NTP2]|nr:universal stress protein [Nitrospira sp. NTP2]
MPAPGAARRLHRRTRRSLSRDPCPGADSGGGSHRHRQTGPVAGRGTPPWQRHPPCPDRIDLRCPGGVAVKTPARTTRTLLLAVDFSRPASRAVPYAIKLASVLNLSLTVVHVLQAPPGFTSWTPVTRRSLDPLRTKAMLELGRVIRFANDNQVPAKYKLLAGVPEDAILQTADEIRAGLIVMGTHGRSGLDRLKLGSVADAVLRRAHCPVFTIRAAAGGHPAVHPLRLNLGRILVATDFSPSSEAALRHATELARLLPAEVLLLHVAADSTETRIEEKFRRALSASRSGDVVGGQLLLQGDPAESILAHATRTKTRLIVMGTQGRRGMERLLLGSVAEAVIRGAHCPVLVVRNGGRHRRPAPPAPTAHRH